MDKNKDEDSDTVIFKNYISSTESLVLPELYTFNPGETMNYRMQIEGETFCSIARKSIKPRDQDQNSPTLRSQSVDREESRTLQRKDSCCQDLPAFRIPKPVRSASFEGLHLKAEHEKIDFKRLYADAMNPLHWRTRRITKVKLPTYETVADPVEFQKSPHVYCTYYSAAPGQYPPTNQCEASHSSHCAREFPQVNPYEYEESQQAYFGWHGGFKKLPGNQHINQHINHNQMTKSADPRVDYCSCKREYQSSRGGRPEGTCVKCPYYPYGGPVMERHRHQALGSDGRPPEVYGTRARNSTSQTARPKTDDKDCYACLSDDESAMFMEQTEGSMVRRWKCKPVRCDSHGNCNMPFHGASATTRGGPVYCTPDCGERDIDYRRVDRSRSASRLRKLYKSRSKISVEKDRGKYVTPKVYKKKEKSKYRMFPKNVFGSKSIARGRSKLVMRASTVNNTIDGEWDEEPFRLAVERHENRSPIKMSKNVTARRNYPISGDDTCKSPDSDMILRSLMGEEDGQRKDDNVQENSKYRKKKKKKLVVRGGAVPDANSPHGQHTTKLKISSFSTDSLDTEALHTKNRSKSDSPQTNLEGKKREFGIKKLKLHKSNKNVYVLVKRKK